MSEQPPSTARRRRQSKPGIVDVAAAAGVSHITVSRVIHDPTAVRPETRERILSTMARLGYTPNHAARALVTGRSRTLGVISVNTALYGPAAALQGLEQAAWEEGYFLTVAGLESLDPHAFRDAVDRLMQQSVAGIVILSPQVGLSANLAQLPQDVPTVLLWGPSSGALPVVMSGEQAGARQATEHLIGLGHEVIHHLAGPAGRFGAEARIAGWLEALTAAHLHVPEVSSGDWSARSGYKLSLPLLRDHKATALFVASDQMALGVFRAAMELGRRIPHDLSVVGFDDIPEAEYYAPPLTTVRQDFNSLGRAAFNLLIAIITDRRTLVDESPKPVQLVLRQSTAPFRG